MPILRGLNDEALVVVSDLFSRWDCRKGQTIFNEGDRSENIYLVAEGELEVQISTGLFGKQVIATLGPGDVFGEMAFIDAERRSASIKAKRSCILLSMTRNDFRKLGKGYPHIQLMMLKNITRILAKRLRTADERIRHLKTKDKGVIEKISKLLTVG